MNTDRIDSNGSSLSSQTQDPSPSWYRIVVQDVLREKSAKPGGASFASSVENKTGLVWVVFSTAGAGAAQAGQSGAAGATAAGHSVVGGAGTGGGPAGGTGPAGRAGSGTAGDGGAPGAPHPSCGPTSGMGLGDEKLTTVIDVAGSVS